MDGACCADTSVFLYLLFYSCVCPNGFTIGRTGFGSVFWPNQIILPDNLHADATVVFRHKEVTVYPDESVKPPVGQGLNRHAEITLERVWPVDKATRKIITDAATLSRMQVSDGGVRARTHLNYSSVNVWNARRSKWTHYSKTTVRTLAHGCSVWTILANTVWPTRRRTTALTRRTACRRDCIRSWCTMKNCRIVFNVPGLWRQRRCVEHACTGILFITQSILILLSTLMSPS